MLVQPASTPFHLDLRHALNAQLDHIQTLELRCVWRALEANIVQKELELAASAPPARMVPLQDYVRVFRAHEDFTATLALSLAQLAHLTRTARSSVHQL